MSRSTVMASICIVTGLNLCRNPRVVKEATALSEAGYSVTIVGPSYSDELAEEDRKITGTGLWKHECPVDLSPTRSGKLSRTLMRLRRRLSSEAVRFFGFQSPHALAYGMNKLKKKAFDVDADLYIAHLEVGLWVGRELLKAGKLVGVDFEDWYSRDLLPSAQKYRPVRLLQECEEDLLNNSCFSYAPSAAMARELSIQYSCPLPTVLYNAFPCSDFDSIDKQNKDRKDLSKVSFHWVSQTIGPGRGLESFFSSLKLVNFPVEVHLRGNLDVITREWLYSQFPFHIGHSLFIHKLVPPNELLSRIAEHDIGLALELSYPDNKNLTISNKILHYIAGGLAVIASDTEGQKEVEGLANGAVKIFANGDEVRLAEVIREMVINRADLDKTKNIARRVAKNIFNWENEETKVVCNVKRALSILNNNLEKDAW